MKTVATRATRFLILLPLVLIACAKSDPILEGDRVPIFRSDALTIDPNAPKDFGKLIDPEKCDFTIDANNQIWRGAGETKRRVFAGFPTESHIESNRRPACGGKFVYAGLSTGELVKVNALTRNVEWTADIFADNAPTTASAFLDLTATPVYFGGHIYAGGLGGAFCKVRDKDGSKAWCVPILATDIICATDKFIIVETPGKTLAVSLDGKAFETKEGEIPCPKK